MNTGIVSPVIMAAALFFAVGLPGATVAAEVYKWTDENGVVHFSDTQPMDRDVQVENLPDDDPPAGPNPYADDQAGSSAAEQRREEIADQARESREQAALTEQNCQDWQEEVDRLEPSRRVFYTNEQGETERMDDVARADRVAELKLLIAENCR